MAVEAHYLRFPLRPSRDVYRRNGIAGSLNSCSELLVVDVHAELLTVIVSQREVATMKTRDGRNKRARACPSFVVNQEETFG